MLVFVAILMAWDDGATQIGRFKSARQALREMFPACRAVGKSYQGFIKSLLKVHLRLLEIVAVHLRDVLRGMAGPFWTREGLLAFAIDGSRIECPRTKANEEAFGRGGKKGCGPQMWLTTMWHMGTGLPWSWMQGRSDESERNHLRQMLHLLPAAALVVADAGFVGYELLRDILSGGRSFLIRVGGNVRLLTNLGCYERFGVDTVYLWPNSHRAESPLVLRLIVLQRGCKNIYLVTNMSESSLSLNQAATLYGMRWGVEVFFRSLKQTLEHRAMRSRAPRQAQAELAWSVVGLQLMGLMSIREMIAKGIDPLQWSVAATRDLIRQAMCAGPQRRLSPAGWKNRLGACLKDTYVRSACKDARQWPDRKHERPPRPPKIRAAFPEEVLKAQGLLAKLAAA